MLFGQVIALMAALFGKTGNSEDDAGKSRATRLHRGERTTAACKQNYVLHGCKWTRLTGWCVQARC